MPSSPSAKQKLKDNSHGVCPLLDLPLSVLYEITKLLDMRSQRSFFMSSAQLYQKWHMQAPTQDPDWLFFSWSLDSLVQASSDSGYDMEECRASATFADAKVHASVYSNDPEFQLTIEPSTRATKRQFSLPEPYPTQDDVFHALLGGPDLLSSRLVLMTSDFVRFEHLKSVAEHMLSLLKQSQGYLFFHMDEALSDDAEKHELYDMETPSISLSHVDGEWEVDHEICITNPPVLNFDKMPSQVTRLEAQLYSRNMNVEDLDSDVVHVFVDFDPECVYKKEFAYNGNVDLDAWAKAEKLLEPMLSFHDLV